MKTEILCATALVLLLTGALAGDIATVVYKGNDTTHMCARFVLSNQSSRIIAHEIEAHVIHTLQSGVWTNSPKPYVHCDGNIPSYLFVDPATSAELKVLCPPTGGIWRVGVECAELTNAVSDAFLKQWRSNPMAVLTNNTLCREYVTLQMDYRKSRKALVWSEPVGEKPNTPFEATSQ